MAFYAFYVIAITILVLHFTGWLKRNNLEWLVLVLAVATFPAVIFLKYPGHGGVIAAPAARCRPQAATPPAAGRTPSG